jgi:hypothetical protein
MTRSWTSWRALKMLVPGLKNSSIEASWGTDFDRITSSPGKPAMDCSKGIVTRDSTSAADRPTHGI